MTRPISDDAARYLTFIGHTRKRGEVGIDAATDQLIYRGRVGATHEVVDTGSTQTVTGDKTFSGTTVSRRPVEITTATTDTLTTAESGKVFISTLDTGTQVFTLPSAATAGLSYTFVCGHADTEIHVGVTGAQQIKGKTHGAENGTGIATTATTGLLKNTAANNVVGDFCTLVSDGSATWYMVAVAGVWSGT